jgi:hypothetical protein
VFGSTCTVDRHRRDALAQRAVALAQRAVALAQRAVALAQRAVALGLERAPTPVEPIGETFY